MKLVIDMNLSPRWVAVLVAAGHDAVHWSTVGAPAAPDENILAWAAGEGRIVFTHDLDFGAILAATGSQSPSVLPVCAEDVSPASLSVSVLAALAQFADELADGALVIIDARRARVRVLPLT